MVSAPLIVMVRRLHSLEGWRVNVAAEGRFTLDEHVELAHSPGADSVELSVRAGRVDAPGDAVKREGLELWDVAMGAPVVIRRDQGSLELVCFRAADTTPAPKLSPRVLEAIDAVRRQDTPEARTVLSDVLEETGALAEAGYVRLEQELQRRPAELSEHLVSFRALGAVVGTTFRYLVGRDVLGCVGMRWTFRCPRQWDEMTPTADEQVRACQPCRQLVARADSEDEAKDLARRGVCVSLRVPELEDWEGELAEPEPVGDLAVTEEPED